MKEVNRIREARENDESNNIQSISAISEGNRKLFFKKWMTGISNTGAIINLPSIFKGYAGRVLESMAAFRPVISWRPSSLRSQALFVPGKEIIWFDRNSNKELHNKVKQINNDRKLAAKIANNARNKILKYHTAEVRVRQILDWIYEDIDPDYGEEQHSYIKNNNIIKNKYLSNQYKSDDSNILEIGNLHQLKNTILLNLKIKRLKNLITS